MVEKERQKEGDQERVKQKYRKNKKDMYSTVSTNLRYLR